MVTGQSVTDASGTVHPMPVGEYRFPLAALGRYSLRVVPPAGFTVPSTVPVETLRKIRRPEGNLVDIIDASFGAAFALTSPAPVRVDIPMDSPSEPLSVSKAASREIINPGDPVIFTVLASNPNAKRGINSVLVWGENAAENIGKQPTVIAPYNYHRMLNDCAQC